MKIKKSIDIMKEKNFFLLLIIFAVWFVIFSGIYPLTNDDVTFFTKIQENGLIETWLNHVETWSARFIIELVYFTIYSLPHFIWIFRIVNSFMFTLISYCLLTYTDNNNFSKQALIISFLPFLFPVGILETAGWLSTSANYLWPAALMLYAFLPIASIIRDQPVKKHYYFTSTLAFIFASNEEQCSALMLGMLTCLILYDVFNKRRIKVYLFLLELFAVIMMLFSLLWEPSTKIRLPLEINSWYPSFAMQSLFDKLTDGFFSTVQFLFYPSNIFVLVFSLLLGILVNLNYEQKEIRILGWIPSVFFITLGVLQNITISIFPALEKFYITSFDQYSIFNVNPWISFIIEGCLIMVIALSCFIAWKDVRIGGIGALLWVGGIVSRVIMGISPTLYASSSRTFSFMIINIILITAMILNELLKRREYKYKIYLENTLLTLLCVCVVYQFYIV